VPYTRHHEALFRKVSGTFQLYHNPMPMSRWDRKALLPHGAVTQIAQRTGRAKSHVSSVIHGHRRDRRVEVAVARLLRLPVDEVFPPPRDQEAAA
jgi:hypothetical protein